LEPFETELLEQPTVICDRAPPLEIVIALVERIAVTPPTAGDSVFVADEATARDLH
jgi:hypothetical protein